MNVIGSSVPLTLQRRKRGKKTKRIREAITVPRWRVLLEVEKKPGITRPKKSKVLNIRKEKGTKRSL